MRFGPCLSNKVYKIAKHIHNLFIYIYIDIPRLFLSWPHRRKNNAISPRPVCFPNGEFSIQVSSRSDVLADFLRILLLRLKSGVHQLIR